MSMRVMYLRSLKLSEHSEVDICHTHWQVIHVISHVIYRFKWSKQKLTFEIASGASLGSTAAPYGLSCCMPPNACCNALIFSFWAASFPIAGPTLSGLPLYSTLFRFLTQLSAVARSWYSMNPYPFGFPVSRSWTSLKKCDRKVSIKVTSKENQMAKSCFFRVCKSVLVGW